MSHIMILSSHQCPFCSPFPQPDFVKLRGQISSVLLLTNPDRIDAIYADVFKAPHVNLTRDFFSTCVKNYQNAKRQITSIRAENESLEIHLKSKRAALAVLPSQQQEARLRADQMQLNLERFDLNCGGLTQKQFDNPIFYGPKAKERERLVTLRDQKESEFFAIGREIEDTRELVEELSRLNTTQQDSLRSHEIQAEVIFDNMYHAIKDDFCDLEIVCISDRIDRLNR